MLAVSKMKFREVEWNIEIKLILMERATGKYFTGRRGVRQLRRCPLGAQPCEMVTQLEKAFCMLAFYSTESVSIVPRNFWRKYYINKNPPNANSIRSLDRPTEAHVLATVFTGAITPLDFLPWGCVENEVPLLKQHWEM
jgi:hypothetical protein